MEVLVASDEKPKKRRRSWFQFSLRFLLIAVLVVGVFLGVRTRRIQRHEQAIVAIESLGGSVSVEYDRPAFLPGWVDDKTGWLVGLVRPKASVAYWPAIERPEVLVRHFRELCNLQKYRSPRISDTEGEIRYRKLPSRYLNASFRPSPLSPGKKSDFRPTTSPTTPRCRNVRPRRITLSLLKPLRLR